MKYLLAIMFWVLPVFAMAQTTNTIVVQYPDRATTVTFALTDQAAPAPLTLHFSPPTTATVASWSNQVQAQVDARLGETQQGVKGLGGDARHDAIKSVYRDLISEQKNAGGMIQHYLDLVVKIRFQLEALRGMFTGGE